MDTDELNYNICEFAHDNGLDVNKCRAIPKSELLVGETYKGVCRNAGEAVWKGDVFEYMRYKFGGVYPEEINHYEDDDGYDVFVPCEGI